MVMTKFWADKHSSFGSGKRGTYWVIRHRDLRLKGVLGVSTVSKEWKQGVHLQHLGDRHMSRPGTRR